MYLGFRRAYAPDYPLMQLCYLQPKIFVKVKQCHIIKAFGHVINTTRIVGMYDLHRYTVTLFNVLAVKFSHTVPLWNSWPFNSSVTVDTHSSQMNHMARFVKFHDRDQNIFRWLSIVSECVVDCLNALHRVGCSTLLGQMDYDIRPECLKGSLEFRLLMGYVDFGKSYSLSCQFLPFLQSLLDWSYWSHTTIPIFRVYLTPGQIINNQDLMSQIR